MKRATISINVRDELEDAGFKACIMNAWMDVISVNELVMTRDYQKISLQFKVPEQKLNALFFLGLCFPKQRKMFPLRTSQ